MTEGGKAKEGVINMDKKAEKEGYGEKGEGTETGKRGEKGQLEGMRTRDGSKE